LRQQPPLTTRARASRRTLTRDARRIHPKSSSLAAHGDSKHGPPVGPVGADAFQPNENCVDYTDAQKHGASRKFHCTLRTDVKVRRASNGEVRSGSRRCARRSVSRPTVYPVRVRCRGCSSGSVDRRGSQGECTNSILPSSSGNRSAIRCGRTPTRSQDGRGLTDLVNAAGAALRHMWTP
jgi:hypothetical protein